mgnify:CR=1 FL=1|tara:strand:- start:5203 stop:6327 length:1125 start_codon:yes stop_codon:yes gene_type:complete
MAIKHAKLSASGSSRWLNCPGSVQAESSYPNTSSSASNEGSCAHEVADLCLRNNEVAESYLGQVFFGVKVDQEMVEHVQGYVDFVLSFEGELFPEQQVDFSPWVPDGFGTSDAIVIQKDKVQIIDLKYGKGVEVLAENNSQAMLYALGVYNDYGYLLDDQETFVLHIYQPRIGNFSEWEISLKDLLKWGEWVKLQADLALSKDAERVPGDKQCQWCRAKGDCKALFNYTQKIIMAEFDDIEALENPDNLSNEQKRIVIQNRPLIESWLKSVEQSVMTLMLDGAKFAGFKLVEGRSNRKWSDEEQAKEVLLSAKGEDEIYTKKLISAPQAEKLLGKNEKHLIADLIIKPNGKPTLAPESDKRPPIGDVTDLFEEM